MEHMKRGGSFTESIKQCLDVLYKEVQVATISSTLRNYYPLHLGLMQFDCWGLARDSNGDIDDITWAK